MNNPYISIDPFFARFIADLGCLRQQKSLPTTVSMVKTNSKRVTSGEAATKIVAIDPFQLLATANQALGTQASDWFNPYRALATRMFRRAGINDPDLIDAVRSQVAINFASSVNKGRYDPNRATVGAYLWGLVRITCLSEIRRHKRFPMLQDEFNQVTDDRHDPSMRAESQEIIRLAIAKLPARYRVALCVEYGIRDVDGTIPMQVEPRNSVVLFRAHRRLRKLLSDRYPDIDVLF